MKIIKYFAILMHFIFIINSVSSQGTVNIDNTRALYIYEFITNDYLSNIDFWSSRSNVQSDYNISNNYIEIINKKMSRKELDNFLIYFSIDTIDKLLDIFNSINLKSIHTQFKTNISSSKNSIPDSILCKNNCRAILFFSDIFIKDNRYFVAVIGKTNMQGLAILSDEIIYEFEICRKNGFINFISYMHFMGRSEEDFKNNTFSTFQNKFKDYFPCGYIDKPNNKEPCEQNKKQILLNKDSIMFEDIRLKTYIKPVNKSK